MCRMLGLMTKFITDLHGVERVIFRQSAGYIGNMPSFSKQSLPQLELGEVGSRLDINAEDEGLNFGSHPFWHLEFKQGV